ncbi:MAG: oxidoreductase [Gemmatimonadales bacterium]|nr:MAG: oxidoreductase [Gemmatimonadales bacterium]
MNGELTVGVVGAGAIVQVAHLPVLSRMPEVRVVGICDNDVVKARAVAARFGVPRVYEDIEDLLEDADPEVVAVCTPNHLHEIHVRTALSAGKHVLCERPLALSAAGVESIISARDKAGRVVMVGMNHRFRSDVQALRTYLRTGELGAITGVRCGWYAFRPSGEGSTWRQRRERAGGGALLDLGLSLVDLALWLTGCPKPKRVSAHLDRDGGDSEVEEAGCALIVCEGDLSIIADVSRRYVGEQERFWFEITGRLGSAKIHPLRIFREIRGVPTNVTPSGAASREDAFTTSYRAEWAHFAAMVRGRVERSDLLDQVVLHRVMEALYRSAQEGRDIAL